MNYYQFFLNIKKIKNIEDVLNTLMVMLDPQALSLTVMLDPEKQ
jgi:hypothetical protein